MSFSMSRIFHVFLFCGTLFCGPSNSAPATLTPNSVHVIMNVSSSCIQHPCITLKCCVGFREPNEDAVRLVHEMKLKLTVPMIRMYRSGRYEAISSGVFAITSLDVCGF